MNNIGAVKDVAEWLPIVIMCVIVAFILLFLYEYYNKKKLKESKE